MTTEPIGIIESVIRKGDPKRPYIFGTVTSDKIKNLTFVPVIEHSRKTYVNEETSDGYQRPGSSSRMRAFSRFLMENPDSVVPPVLLSGRDQWEFEEVDEPLGVGRLSILGQAAVIDGQHRLGGFVHLYEEENIVREISFILLPDLTIEEETREFVVVNNSQKGVPRPLTAFLADSEEVQVAWALNESSDGPFGGRITRTSMERTHLFALHSVAKQVGRMFSVGAIHDAEIDAKIDYMSRFWTIIADALEEEWSDIEKLDDQLFRGRRDFEYKLLELTGLIAWTHVGSHILLRSYTPDSGVNWYNVRRLVEAVCAIDWSKEGDFAGRTGEVGGRLMGNEMIKLLPAESEPAED